MELLQLKYFLAAAEYDHMTEAANALNVAQPSISLAISKLEAELGVKLFDRHGKKIKLNDYGRIFAGRIEPILRELKDAQTEIESIYKAEKQPLRISFWNSSNIIPSLLVGFKEKYPHTHIQAYHDAKDASFDFQFCVSSFHVPTQAHDILLQEEVCLAVPLDSPLAKKDSISLSEAKDECFISLSPAMPFRRTTDDFCEMAGFSCNTIIENENHDTIKKLVSLGTGVAFFPQKSWGNAESGGYKLLRISMPICIRTIYLLRGNDRPLSGIAKLFRDFSIDYFARM